ncbi:STAS domain-containing protein [Nocardiopsis sp. EMB25]|uniref:STAS domain-containing protein n=1 Tax=Nocardiopsis sp. EMB25 TaxID=2835867 RepID=UPI002283DF1D|nr:STAS domain-containing protein [Nocardiopsis sp. EMB25]MCY9783558.1 STAS domain-containing protein [Nocardiopsis sp. EMB25]
MTVVPVHGEVDLATAGRMRDRLLRAAHDSRCDCLVVDMSGLDFFDASGLRALLSVSWSLTREGRHMVLAEPSPIAARVLDALGMGRVFEIYPLVEMALTHTSGLRVDGAPVSGGPVTGTP